MPWELEIHHIDLRGNGDSTLIIARNVPAVAGGGPQVRSVLIDGGLLSAGAWVQAYIVAQLGVAGHVDAIINTHYDLDHTNGLTFLLRQPGLFDNTIIYDQGWEGGAGADATVVRYLNAINGRNTTGTPIGALAGANRTRVTFQVRADGIPPIAIPAVGGLPAAPAGVGAVNLPAHWLISNPAAPQDPLWNGAGVAAPAGAPTMRFIAANRYVRTAAGGVAGPIGGLGTDPRNEKSLAVEVAFGNFRYYAGGDIETAQENHIQTLLNPADDTAGRVLAFKTSHHGAATATSRGFVDQLRPEAAFISCGTTNHYGHPFMQVLNILDGYGPLAALHGPPPPEPPNRQVRQYMTGYANVGPPPVPYGTDLGITAGNPTAGAYQPGHIKLMVTAAEAAAAVEGRLYTAVEAATRAALTEPAIAGALGAGAAGPVAAAAAEEAMLHGAGPAASEVIDQIAGAGTPGSAAALAAANGAPLPAGPPGMTMALEVATAAMNAGTAAAVAAGAGAAAGAFYGDGTNASIMDAVSGALGAVGMAAGPAMNAGLNAALASPPPPALFRVRLWSQFFPGGANFVVGTIR